MEAIFANTSTWQSDGSVYPKMGEKKSIGHCLIRDPILRIHTCPDPNTYSNSQLAIFWSFINKSFGSTTSVEEPGPVGDGKFWSKPD